jgi:hypothetical protein
MGVKSGVLVRMTILKKHIYNFLDRVFGVRVTTPNCLVYGKLGRYPLDINIKCRMIILTGIWFLKIKLRPILSKIFCIFFTYKV